jgi:hypothetical protein
MSVSRGSLVQSIDIHRSHRQLLEELRVASSRAIEDGNPSHMTVTFAVLLVKLSEQADAATRRIARLTWVIFFLTVILAVFVLPPVIDDAARWIPNVFAELRRLLS